MVCSLSLNRDLYLFVCICHGRKSNLVEFQILPVENPTNINLVESPTGVHSVPVNGLCVHSVPVNGLSGL